MPLEIKPAFDRYLASLGPERPSGRSKSSWPGPVPRVASQDLLDEGIAMVDGLNPPEYRRQLARRASCGRQ